jgi:hypothetical protein
MRWGARVDRSVVVEELAEGVAKTRLFPAWRSAGYHAERGWWGTGLDVWEILELLRAYAGDEERLCAAHPWSANATCASRAYGERFPDEIAAFVEDSRRPLGELRQLYPFLQTGR